MQINGEDVEPITAFAQLQVGDSVYLRPCGRCGSEWHRFFLVKLKHDMVLTTVFGLVSAPRGYEVLPRPRCCAGCAFPVIIEDSAVDGRLVFRVVDPKRSEAHRNHEEMVENTERIVVRRMADYIKSQIASGVIDRPYSKP